MALLTAEDVLNKAFSKTKYREGFDQDEVDDFLDEVAHTVTSLIAERDDLAARLQQAQAGGSGAQYSGEAAPLTEAGGVPGTSGLLGAATDPNPPSPAGMLAMAQKLHDEYVNAGEEEKERIVDEAKTKAEAIVEQAQEDAKGRMDDLASERSELESKIDDLRRFERDYRARIKSFLENLLGDLDHGTSREVPMTPAADEAPADGFTTAAAVEWPDHTATEEESPADESSDNVESSDHDESSSDESSDHEQKDSSDHVESSDEHEEQAPSTTEDAADQSDDTPPVRQSFGYQPPTQAPASGFHGGEQNAGNPFAPVTQQQPIVRPGDVAGGDGNEPPRYPNAF
ncbi:DivIVA domain-containing protein [Demequina aurantiaca]|uniref:DivIVA domain-containing protein n=1 Tax=Demequina aurantiaca TaxID=676200 RepID=UPI003D336BFA